MFRERANGIQAISLSVDIFCICLAFGLALLLRFFHHDLPLLSGIPAQPWTTNQFVRSDYAVLLGVSLTVWVVSLRRSGVYRSHRFERVTTILCTYLTALVIAGVATGAIAFALKMSSISRVFFGYYLLTSLLLLFGKQLVATSIARWMRRSGFNQRQALVIGAGKPALWFSEILREAAQTGYCLIGLIATRRFDPSGPGDVPILGTIDELDYILDSNPVEEVFLVGSAADIAQMAPVAQKLVQTGRVVSLITPLEGGSYGLRGRVTEFSGVPMISFGPVPKDEIDMGIRRVIDVAASLVGLIVLSPLMLVVAALITLLDPGPVIFSQKRLGLGRKPFRLHKFRSMCVDAEKVLQLDPILNCRYVQNDYKLAAHEDPRISKLGRFLRKSSLDELPQLWNVLKGEMTLVGPRPIVPAEIKNYEPYADLLLAIAPGLTGRWQVSGRSDVQYPERAFMDLDYVGGDHSIVSDLGVMLQTVPAVLGRRGSH